MGRVLRYGGIGCGGLLLLLVLLAVIGGGSGAATPTPPVPAAARFPAPTATTAVTVKIVDAPPATASIAPASVPTVVPSPTSPSVATATPNSPTAAPAPPTTAPVPSTATPVPAPAAPTARPFASGGLGLSRSEWERLHGAPTRDDGLFLSYKDGAYVATFVYGNLHHAERVWGDRNPVTLQVAREVGKTLIPVDAQLVRSYVAPGSRDVDLYRSESLKTRFAPDDPAWVGAEPGVLIVIYRAATGPVTSIVVATGNNP
jgi:hypothetical protein